MSIHLPAHVVLLRPQRALYLGWSMQPCSSLGREAALGLVCLLWWFEQQFAPGAAAARIGTVWRLEVSASAVAVFVMVGAAFFFVGAIEIFSQAGTRWAPLLGS